MDKRPVFSSVFGRHASRDHGEFRVIPRSRLV
jgi:hypothetical protein